jgi:hypothetical protein
MITYISTSFSPDLLNPLCSINKKSDLVYAQCCVLCAMDVRQIEPFHLTELITRPLRQLCKPNRLCHKRLQKWQPTNFYPPSLLWKNKNGSFAFMQAWISEMRGLNIKQPIKVGPIYCLCSSLHSPLINNRVRPVMIERSTLIKIGCIAPSLLRTGVNPSISIVSSSSAAAQDH